MRIVRCLAAGLLLAAAPFFPQSARADDDEDQRPSRLFQLSPGAAPLQANAPLPAGPAQAGPRAPSAPAAGRTPPAIQAYGRDPEAARPTVPPVLGGTPCVALTFDDGPDPNLTPRLLAILSAEGVKATFFVLGVKTATWPDVVRAAAEAGNEIGNHSWDHPPLPSLADDAVRRQIANTDAAIRKATGSVPRVLRPPYGSISPRVRALDSRPWVLWYIDTRDWRTHSAANTVQAASAAPTGSIVLMHDTQPSTVSAAQDLIRGLKARGFQFVTVSEMLAGACGAYPARQVSL